MVGGGGWPNADMRKKKKKYPTKKLFFIYTETKVNFFWIFFLTVFMRYLFYEHFFPNLPLFIRKYIYRWVGK